VFTVEVDCSGLDQPEARTKIALGQQLRTATTGAAAEAVRFAKTTAPFRDRTGQLRASIHVETSSYSARSAESAFVSPQFYAGYVEYGTRAHEIWPKEGHGVVGPLRRSQGRRERDDIGTHRVALRWFVGGDGSPGNEGQAVFARMVHHPGSKPYPFMQPARDHAESWLLTELERGFLKLHAIWA
jgi:hypothetical protein